MADDAALISLLQTSRFNTAIRAGNNSELLRLGNATKAGSDKVWDDISVVDFMDAYGTAPIPANVEARLRLLVHESSVVPTSKPGIRDWFQSNVSPTVETALKELAEREQTWFEDAGAGMPSLNDVRLAVAQISKSHIVQQASPAAEAARQARRIIKRRASAQIQQLREKMMPAREQEFVDFRNAIFATQGADQADTDQLRVAMIDAKISEEGI